MPDLRKPVWITVAEAAGLMGLGKRGASKRLVKLNAQLEGRLLREVGVKAMPSGVQPSKYLVSMDVLRQAVLEPEPAHQERELDDLRSELLLTTAKLESLRRAVRPLLRLTRANGIKQNGNQRAQS